jgi:glycosyltransferase involved in cell wall biosynthesis
MPNDPARPETVALMLESEGPGGAEVVLLHLAEELRRLGQGLVPVVLTRAAEPGWLERECARRGFAPERVGIRGALDWRCLRDTIAVLRRRGVTAVHSHEFGMAIYGTAASRWLRLPHVISMHGNMWMTLARRRRVALRWAIRNSAATAAVSEDTRRHLLESLGVAPSSITTVLNGVPDPGGDRTKVRRELGLEDAEVLVVAVGNLIERKGHAILLRALAAIRRSDPDLRWRVAIAGEGVERPALEALAASPQLSGRVHLLGHRSDVADVLAAADVFTMPSIWEGLPLAVLEAMFAGCAVVASDVSGIPEAIPTPEVGRLVKPGDEAGLAATLRPLLRDRALRESLGRGARDRAVAQFTAERMARDYLRLLRAR